jgi:hypothetical protein
VTWEAIAIFPKMLATGKHEATSFNKQTILRFAGQFAEKVGGYYCGDTKYCLETGLGPAQLGLPARSVC